MERKYEVNEENHLESPPTITTIFKYYCLTTEHKLYELLCESSNTKHQEKIYDLRMMAAGAHLNILPCFISLAALEDKLLGPMHQP